MALPLSTTALTPSPIGTGRYNMDLTPDAMRPHRDEALARQLINEAREPMRRAIDRWLDTWWTSIPKSAVEQMKAIRDAHESREDSR